MNACPGEDDLLRFLEGELDAQDDARIVVHVEDCANCQERLERLTRGTPAPGDVSTVETVDRVSGRCGDPAGTEIEGPGSEPGPPGDGRSTESGGDAGATKDLRPVPGGAEDRDDAAEPARLEDTAEASDPTLTVDRAPEPTDPPDRDRHGPRGNRRADGPGGWPDVAGYEILQRLGEGGMGVVYKARHLGLNRLVALKMIRGGSQARADHFARFRVEAESVARLRHPNIIQIYDIGEAAGLPFVALELLDGGSLDDRLAGNPQPGRQAGELMITMARAVHVAHEAGIIHLDLKPANVLYSSDGVLKITDFGLAKRVDSDDGHTQSGQIMGSPSYMAPEQARGDTRNVGPAADIYALGAILYEMLTGRPPFKGATPIETVRQVVDDDPVTPSRLVPRLPRDLETICLKSLNKDPARRYGSARALADDLNRYLDGEPIEARRTPFWERGAKWARRRPLHAAAAALVVLALTGAVTGLFAYQGFLLRQSRSIAAASTQGARLLEEANAALFRRNVATLEAAQDRISDFLAKFRAVQDDPQLKPLMADLAARRAEVSNRLADVRREQADREKLTAEVRRLQDFRDRVTEVKMLDTHFTNLDLPVDQDRIRLAAKAALDIYAAPGADDSWTLGPLPAGWSEPDRAGISEGCYELLLVLSQAEKTAEQGLRRLDQAARLRPDPARSWHSRRAACLERAGDARAAEDERRAADRLEPSTPFDHYLAGQDRYRRGELIAALQHFDQAIQQQPDHFWAQCLTAVCWHRLGHPEIARPRYDTCLIREPRSAWLHLLRGVASGVAPAGAPLAEVRLHAVAAEDAFRRAMEILDQKPNAELRYALLVNRGLLRSLRQDWDAAAADLKAAIDLGDAGALASGNLAKIELERGRYDEAYDAFSRAIRRRPDWPPLYRGRAEVVLESKDSTPARRAEALADLNRAIRLEKPDNPVLARDHTSRGRLLALDGRPTEAIAACEAAIERVRDYPDAHLLRLELLRRLKRHDDVIRSCDPLIARGKASGAIYERRAMAREAIRDFPGAIEDFTSAMALGGDRLRLLRLRGWVYIVADAPRLALHDFKEAIRLDPSDGDAHNGRGLARLRIGEHGAAVADAEKAISHGEPTVDLFYKAARVYALAAVVVSAEVRKRGPESVFLVTRYQDRAADLLREAIRRLPADRRAPFVKDVILADPGLRTLRRRLTSMDLAGSLPSRSPAAAAPGQ